MVNIKHSLVHRIVLRLPAWRQLILLLLQLLLLGLQQLRAQFSSAAPLLQLLLPLPLLQRLLLHQRNVRRAVHSEVPGELPGKRLLW